MGFDARDWGDRRRPRRHRTFDRHEPLLAPQEWHGAVVLDRHVVTDPAMLDRARTQLADRLDRHCEQLGFAVDPETVSWGSFVIDETGATQLELRAMVVPRTDGVWGEIRVALAEDEADRQEAIATRGDIDDKLDRLGRGAEWWAGGPPDPC